MTEELKRTPLFEFHKENGGRLVPFAGWEMPVQYEGIQKEHLATRSGSGLFDVSHMGEIRITGPEALEAADYITTQKVTDLKEGTSQYNLLPNHSGGLVDDCLVYNFEDKKDYLFCVNASNTEKVWSWLNDALKLEEKFDIVLWQDSTEWGQIALQGPTSFTILDKINPEVSSLKNFEFKTFKLFNVECVVAATGYTGEKGVEIFVPWNETNGVWHGLLEQGADLGIKACGLGARDTLRTEVAFSLYGNEIDDNSNPFECRLSWAIDLDKPDFVGKAALLKKKEEATKKLVGLKLKARGVPRHDYPVYQNLEEANPIGVVTSGTHSPSLDIPIAICKVPKSVQYGDELFVEMRNRRVAAEVCKLPFYKATPT